MPPIKEYKFQDNSETIVIILAYSLEQATNRLERMVKYPDSFKLINR